MRSRLRVSAVFLVERADDGSFTDLAALKLFPVSLAATTGSVHAPERRAPGAVLGLLVLAGQEGLMEAHGARRLSRDKLIDLCSDFSELRNESHSVR